MNSTELSKLLALILRHNPHVIGIELDEHGWADVSQLITGINKQIPFDMNVLEEIVATDSKKRYSFNADKTLIRANQGHSVSVDIELTEITPPRILYHGTGEKYITSIMKHGLLPKSRLYVHLSSDYETAMNVGSRHGKPVIIEVSAKKMFEKGYKFYLSENKVWLTKKVPCDFLSMI